MKIIVIGAGVLGAKTSYHLARAGAEVILIDQQHDGRASAAGAGIICPWASQRRPASLFELLAASADYYGDLLDCLAEDGEPNVSYRKVGALVVASDPGTLDHVEKSLAIRAAAWRAAGKISRLSTGEAAQLFPPLRGDLQAVHISGGARVDGRLLVAALKRAAQRRGVQLVPGEARLTFTGKRVSGVTLSTELLSADLVVAAAGAWGSNLMRSDGPFFGVSPQRGQIVHLHLQGFDTQNWPVVLPQSDHYLLTFDDSRVVIGATRETGSGFDYRITAAGQAEVIREGLLVAPGLADATLLETRVGFRPVSADGQPLLGFWCEGLVVGNGLGASGLTLGPLCGKLLADLALENAPALSLEPFRPDRFI